LIFEFVYISFMAPMADIRSVAEIVRKSRVYNHAHGLTGVLVFDGERFCQHIEGDREAVLLLAEKIAGDRRHQNFTVLHQDFSGTARRFGQWHLGYALDSRGDFMQSLSRKQGPEAVSFLHQQIPALVLLP
jgi:hypothetical protein